MSTSWKAATWSPTPSSASCSRRSASPRWRATRSTSDWPGSRDGGESSGSRASGGGMFGDGARAAWASSWSASCAGCRMGVVTGMGVSLGLTVPTIMGRGTLAQQERWLPDLVTYDKVGAWAITEPDSGSDAFGGMKSYVVRDGETTSSTARRPSSPTARRRRRGGLRQARRRRRDASTSATARC